MRQCTICTRTEFLISGISAYFVNSRSIGRIAVVQAFAMLLNKTLLGSRALHLMYTFVCTLTIWTVLSIRAGSQAGQHQHKLPLLPILHRHVWQWIVSTFSGNALRKCLFYRKICVHNEQTIVMDVLQRVMLLCTPCCVDARPCWYAHGLIDC